MFIILWFIMEHEETKARRFCLAKPRYDASCPFKKRVWCFVSFQETKYFSWDYSLQTVVTLRFFVSSCSVNHAKVELIIISHNFFHKKRVNIREPQWKIRTFALSMRVWENARRAPKICFQAWQILRPAQRVKTGARMTWNLKLETWNIKN